MEIDVNLVSYELMISYSERLSQDVPVFSLVKSCHIWFNPVIYALLKSKRCDIPSFICRNFFFFLLYSLSKILQKS